MSPSFYSEIRSCARFVEVTADRENTVVYDVFLSYAHADRQPVLLLRDELVARGLNVWLDADDIDDFDSISRSIENGLARSKALVAYYSKTYPTRRACQWELTAAFLAANRQGNPRRRLLVINPESSVDHIEPALLRDQLFGRDADNVVARVEALDRVFSDLGISVRQRWLGRTAIGSSRFVGRVIDMWHIHDALHAGDIELISGDRGDALAQITGMGGVGKSLLAEEYAMRFAAAYPGGVFWLRAFGHDDAASGLLAAEVRVTERERQLFGFAAKLGLDPRELPHDLLEAALARALDKPKQPYLWIVDDLPGGLSRPELDEWVAPGRYGKTLVTTRRREYEGLGISLDLEVLNEAEGVELLTRHVQPESDAERDAAEGLVSDLGGHALAIDVAGSALLENRGIMSFADYRAALAIPTPDELELAAQYAGLLPSGHEASIASTLWRSIVALGAAGLDFLRLAAVLAVQPIPAALVVDVFARADGLDAGAARTRAVEGMHDARMSSLADDAPDGTRQVHALVSRTVRLRESDVDRAIANAAIAALGAQLSAASSTKISADAATLAHARKLAASGDTPAQTMLLGWVATHDFYRGDPRSTRDLGEQVLGQWRQILGEEHPDTLMWMSNVAEALHAEWDYVGARDLHEDILDVRRRALGERHPDTLTSMHNLGVIYHKLRDPVRAAQLLQPVLRARRGTWGEEHPDTLASMSAFAAALLDLGDPTGARALQQHVFHTRKLLLGQEHRDTLAAASGLAMALKALGEHRSAAALNEDVVRVRAKVLGKAHPDTLLAMRNLAATLYSLGEFPRAHDLMNDVVNGFRRELGDEHPLTTTSMQQLAVVRLAMK